MTSATTSRIFSLSPISALSQPAERLKQVVVCLLCKLKNDCFFSGKCRQRTIQGNCCVFPFSYGGRTYRGCTRRGSRFKRAWCATVPGYRKGQPWGYCIGKKCKKISFHLRKFCILNHYYFAFSSNTQFISVTILL